MNNMNKTQWKRISEQSRSYQKYMGYALDIFRWNFKDKNGKPINCQFTSTDLEKMLIYNGQCMFLYDNNIGEYIILNCNDASEMNMYGRSNKKMCYSVNGVYNRILDITKDKCVNIWNNDMQNPTEGYIRDYADRMDRVELAIKNNIKQQLFPYFIKCNAKNKKSWMEMYNQIEYGEPAIFVHDTVDADNMKIINTTVPYIVEQLNQYRYQLENEILTFMGINNCKDKAERLIVDEANSNNEFIQRNIETQLKQRKIACEKINNMYNLDIEVEVVSDIVKRKEYGLRIAEKGLSDIVENTVNNAVEDKTIKQDNIDNIIETIIKKGGQYV